MDTVVCATPEPGPTVGVLVTVPLVLPAGAVGGAAGVAPPALGGTLVARCTGVGKVGGDGEEHQGEGDHSHDQLLGWLTGTIAGQL